MRVAGGWVRDKVSHYSFILINLHQVLGQTSNDIDISLDDMGGQEFAEIIDKELYNGEHKFGVTKVNEEKTKFLQIANIVVCGFELDITNTWEWGTAAEDAQRRDLTINALFYNINEDKVEDFTGRGIPDLKNGIIDTPDEPMVACDKDPMVILRTILFASRLGYTIVSGVKEAALDPGIRTKLM